jgi:tetratricopeptide (TPR) repeat protein
MRLARSFLAVAITIVCATVLHAQQQDTSYTRITTLESAVTRGQATRAQQLELASLYNQAGRFYEASKVTESLLASNPNDAEAKAAAQAASNGRRDTAARNVAAAEAKANGGGASDQDRLALAGAYFDAGSYGAAAAIYEHLPQPLRTRDVRVREARALAWSSQTDRAERAYAALLSEQSTPDLRLEYGRVLTWMGNSHAAITALNDVYTTAPSQDAAIALANARAWSGDREGAIALLNEYYATHPDALQARDLSAQFSSSPELRLEKAGKLIAAQPYNLALHAERARMLYDAGRYAEAHNEVTFVREHSRAKIAELDALDIQIGQRRHEELAKLDQRRAGLDSQAATAMASSSVNNADELLSLAKAYTGLGAYDQSIRLYDRYLQLKSDDTDARIQYARVLSWDKRWNASERQYRILVKQQPDRADLRYEYGQVLSYEPDYSDAVTVFTQLSDLHGNPRANLYTDVPPHAHYSLGQIYRWFGWNEHAVAEQNAAIGLDSSYAAAHEELDLARHSRPASAVDARVTYATDSSDFRMKRLDLEGNRWVSRRLDADLSVGRHEFDHAGDNVSANTVSAGASYRYTDRTTARGRVGLDFYDRGLGTRPYFALGAEFMPSLQSRASVDFNHYDLVYDVFTLTSLGTPGPSSQINLRDPLSINDFRGHYDWNGGGLFSWLADGSYGFVSDNNKRAGVHGLATFRILKSPFLAFKVDARYLSYDFRTNRYWSPNDYRSFAGVVQIGQTVRQKFHWDFEVKAGRAYESGFSSDLRAYEGNITVPLTDSFDLIGNYGYGKSGRLDSVFAGSTSSSDFVNYWQRHWFVGVRAKQLFANASERHPHNQYYYDARPLSESPVVPPLGGSN